MVKNSILTYTKQSYMNNTRLGSVAVGFGHSLESFGYANS